MVRFIIFVSCVLSWRCWVRFFVFVWILKWCCVFICNGVRFFLFGFVVFMVLFCGMSVSRVCGWCVIVLGLSCCIII